MDWIERKEKMRERYTSYSDLITPLVRQRILNYGTDSTRALLQAFDDLGELLDGKEGAN